MKKLWFPFVMLVVFSGLVYSQSFPGNWKVINQPVKYKNVEVFPVVSTEKIGLGAEYLTLDQAVAEKKAEVTEVKPGLLRGTHAESAFGDQYHLVLVNKSGHPIILLAGEVLAGGHQDRILSEDRIIPDHGDPIPIDVLCAEQLRSSGPTDAFLTQCLSSDGKQMSYSACSAGTTTSVQYNNGGSFTAMAAPSVRENAANGNQTGTWNSIANSSAAVTLGESSAATTGGALLSSGSGVWTYSNGGAGASSYLFTEKSQGASIDKESTDIQTKFEKALSKLSGHGVGYESENVIGAVLVVGDQVVLADVFVTTEIFHLYWPKLVRSYVVESKANSAKDSHVDFSKVQDFVKYEESPYVASVHPHEYSLAKITDENHTYILRSLVEKGEPLIHFSRMR